MSRREVNEFQVPRRLEMLRAAKGFRTIREFWMHLGGSAQVYGDGDRLRSYSLQSARRYHYDREPPMAYMRRVWSTFPEVDRSWLVGEAPIDGPMFRNK